MNKLVYGGTPKFLSNRAKEKGCELNPVDDEIVGSVVKALSVCSTLQEVLSLLYKMNFFSTNFVGSRDYVYLSSAMANVIVSLQTEPNLIYDHFRQLTLCCGLRDKVMELMGVEGN